jgi:hypothetical protein
MILKNKLPENLRMQAWLVFVILIALVSSGDLFTDGFLLITTIL